MEDYVKVLRSLLRIQVDNKYAVYNVKKNQQVERVWPQHGRQQQIEYPLHRSSNIAENIGILSDEHHSRHYIQTLPGNVCLRNSFTPRNRYGIWSTTEISKGLRFGPYEGIILYDEEEARKSGYCWQLFEKSGIACFVDAINQNQSNWLRYVNLASRGEEQNLKVLKKDGQIYYETIKDILPNVELKVWYGDGNANNYKYDESRISDNNIFIRHENRVASEKNKIPKKCGISISVQHIQETPNSTAILPESVQMHLKDVIFENEMFEASNNCQENVEKQINQICFYCEVCKKDFSENDFKLHRCARKKEKKFSCDTCDKKFADKSGLKRHQISHTGEKFHACDLCGKKFGRKYQVKLHQRIHTGEKPFSCNFCGKEFARKHDLKVHLRIHTGEKPYSCNLCGKQFARQHTFKLHQYVHTNKKHCVCDLCGKGFARNVDLKSHVHMHTGEKRCACDFCGKGFIKNGDLKSHLCIHIGEKPYICNFCGKRFLRSNELKIHQRVHTDERPFVCDVCGKGFIQACKLKLHQITHTGEKPCICDMCGKRFSTNNQLKLHQLTHTAEKSHICDVCGKGFIHNSKLKRHQRIHTGEKIIING